MENLQERIELNHQEVKYKEVVDKIKLWVDNSMVINRDRITVIKPLPVPFDVTMCEIEELKSYNYTGLEYLITACLSIGEEIGYQKAIKSE